MRSLYNQAQALELVWRGILLKNSLR
jgi:hypothetical protein